MPPSDDDQAEPPVSGGSGGHPRSLFASGAVFGRYAIEGRLGEGGMGHVYCALDTKLGRKVALKVIPVMEDDPRSAERIARLSREARAAAALDHPNAVAIFDVGEISGVPFIAMELVSGHPLRRYIRSAEIGWQIRVRWLVEIASALAAAHKKGIVHRDIKPDNVMISREGRVKVLDFGIARRAAASAEPSSDVNLPTITEEGETFGTPRYMAPEQIRSAPLDGRTDQFSWGVLAYELLARTRPWTGAALTVVLKILEETPPPIQTVQPDVPSAVEAIISRSLAKAPEDRWSSMDEIVTELEPFAATSQRARSLPLSLELSVISTADKEAATLGAIRVRSPAQSQAPGGDPAAPVHDPNATTLQWGKSKAAGDPAASHREGEKAGEAAQHAGAGALRRRLKLASFAVLLTASLVFAVCRFKSSQPIAVTDLPSPASTNVPAIAAYREGLANLRSGVPAARAFERALALDPSLAVAHLQLALVRDTGNFDEVRREHFRKAAQQRETLSPRDQALLDAFEPAVQRQPSDWGEAARRMAAAVQSFPHDAQLWLFRGLFTSDFELAIQSADRALAEDPRYADALAMRAQNLAYLGRFAEARVALETCRRHAPASFECLRNLAFISLQEGECADLENTARQFIAAGVDRREGYWDLAQSLAGQGKPAATVREALKRSFDDDTPAPRRKQGELQDQILVAIWTGDFEAAEQGALDLAKEAEPSHRQDVHGRAVRPLIQILWETGRTEEAGRVAKEFLDQQDAWEPDPRAEDWAIGGDITPRLLAVAQRTGKLSREEFSAQRAAWVASWERKAEEPFHNFIWLHGYAALADTPEDAGEAWKALPKYGLIPAFRPKTLAWMGVGPAYLLTGKVNEAVRWLEGVTRSCLSLQSPIEHTQAYAWLGRAHEAQGDKNGACAAYRSVLARWGEAKPRSLTADSARERIRALGCAP